jgi:hypothetical protein
VSGLSRHSGSLSTLWISLDSAYPSRATPALAKDKGKGKAAAEKPAPARQSSRKRKATEEPPSPPPKPKRRAPAKTAKKGRKAAPAPPSEGTDDEDGSLASDLSEDEWEESWDKMVAETRGYFEDIQAMCEEMKSLVNEVKVALAQRQGTDAQGSAVA